jgi:hypothetical protein
MASPYLREKGGCMSGLALGYWDRGERRLRVGGGERRGRNGERKKGM